MMSTSIKVAGTILAICIMVVGISLSENIYFGVAWVVIAIMFQQIGFLLGDSADD